MHSNKHWSLKWCNTIFVVCNPLSIFACNVMKGQGIRVPASISNCLNVGPTRMPGMATGQNISKQIQTYIFLKKTLMMLLNIFLIEYTF